MHCSSAVQLYDLPHDFVCTLCLRYLLVILAKKTCMHEELSNHRFYQAQMHASMCCSQLETAFMVVIPAGRAWNKRKFIQHISVNSYHKSKIKETAHFLAPNITFKSKCNSTCEATWKRTQHPQKDLVRCPIGASMVLNC